jgi:CheY-like chemotaxis protein/HPt (histidine-containing phosphotransfer) domain-containing protein
VRLLVAEDNPTNQVVVRALLARAGYADVHVAGDGAQAVAAAAGQHFDAVLMDCRMPVLDGYDATRELRASGFTGPIIALTANASEAERRQCLALGMNDYLTKPIDGDQLATALARWLAIGPAAPAAAPAATVAPDPPAKSAEPAFDRKLALEFLGGDTALLTLALTTFRGHAPKLMASLREALDAGDAEAAHRHLHSLAGSAGMIGATPLRAAARSLEEQALDGQLAVVAGRVDALDAELARLFAVTG